jgi:hypothetical protein
MQDLINKTFLEAVETFNSCKDHFEFECTMYGTMLDKTHSLCVWGECVLDDKTYIICVCGDVCDIYDTGVQIYWNVAYDIRDLYNCIRKSIRGLSHELLNL